ncbi:hypothetical protein OUZ56_014936 [Daphnia magna]|uniref:Cytochrome P450 n=1 Tax=Daphnia magna TaxID=35525 RepID=A0ABR0ALD0_9CRUS|nr:hypothetical protein OUZ56_014936 [Daphnia magna]
MSSALNSANSLRTEAILSIWLILPAIAVFYYWKWSQSRTVKLMNAIPGRKPLPLLGNLLHLDVYNEEFYKVMAIDWVKKYGPIYSVWLGPRPFVTLASPELVHSQVEDQFTSLVALWLGQISGGMSSALNSANSLRTEAILSIWLILPAIAVFYYWKWSQSRTVKLMNAIPGRKPLPLLGNLLHLDGNHEGGCQSLLHQ